MKCAFDYCIYNKKCKCILKETQINAFGTCEECIIITLDNAFIEVEKEKQLRDIENKLIE